MTWTHMLFFGGTLFAATSLLGLAAWEFERLVRKLNLHLAEGNQVAPGQLWTLSGYRSFRDAFQSVFPKSAELRLWWLLFVTALVLLIVGMTFVTA